MAETLGDIYETFSESQKKMMEAMIMAVLAANKQGKKDEDTEENDSGELKHFGILGMKWGVRRYQNPDGSLTAAGKQRRQSYNGEYKSKTTYKTENKLHKAQERGLLEKKNTGSITAETKTKIDNLKKILEASKDSDAIVKKYGTDPVTGKSSVRRLMKGPWRKTELGKQVKRLQTATGILAGTTLLGATAFTFGINPGTIQAAVKGAGSLFPSERFSVHSGATGLTTQVDSATAMKLISGMKPRHP